MPTTFKDFGIKESYARLVQKALWSYIWEGIYKPMFEILAIKPQLKAKNDLEENKAVIEALTNGKIFYIQNEGFKAKNKFSNKVSLALEKWGAKYDEWTKMYRIPYDKIPKDVLVAIAENKILQQQKIEEIKKYLDQVINNIPYQVDSMVFNKEVVTILDDAGNEIRKNSRSINVIEVELTPEQKEIIAQEYTNNLKYYIKDWEEKRIPEMRAKVQQLVFEGYREDKIAKLLQHEYGVAANKAKFLAHQETSILLAQYKKVTYQEMGFEKFVWRTIIDGKERKLHEKLNGTTWSWEDLPVIDERTLQKGLPGEAYGCRCQAQPYTENMVFKLHNQPLGEDLKKKKIDINRYIYEYRDKMQQRRAKLS